MFNNLFRWDQLFTEHKLKYANEAFLDQWQYGLCTGED